MPASTITNTAVTSMVTNMAASMVTNIPVNMATNTMEINMAIHSRLSLSILRQQALLNGKLILTGMGIIRMPRNQ